MCGTDLKPVLRAPPRRSDCAPGGTPTVQHLLGVLPMLVRSWLDALKSRFTRQRTRRARRAADRSRENRRLFLEGLEDRRVMAFAPAVNYPVDPAPQAMVAADFNNDGRPDLATVNYSSS